MSWESRTPAARLGPQAAGEEPGVTVDHQPQLSWPGLPLGLGRAGILAAGGQAPTTPHPRLSGELSPARSRAQNQRSREPRGGAKWGIPAPVEEGRPQPPACRVGILLKPGVRRGCLCPYHENHTTWTRQTPEPGEVGSNVPPPTPEPSVLDSPLGRVTAGESPLPHRAPAWVVFRERGPFQAGWGVGWGGPPHLLPRPHSRSGFRWRLQWGPTRA